MTIGKIVSGNVRRLNKVKAGKTISVVSGWLCVSTKTVKVEQDTRKGVVDQVKFAKDCAAPIFRNVLNS